MFILITLLLIVSFSLNEGQEEQIPVADGPCPTPEPVKNYKPRSFLGIWYLHYTNAKMIADRKCMENKVTPRPGGRFFIVSRFINNDTGKSNDAYNLSIPVSYSNAAYNVGRKIDNDDIRSKWIYDGWIYTFVGQSENGTVEYACLPIGGNKHLEITLIRSRYCVMPEKEFQYLADIGKQKKIPGEWYQVDHNNCHYTLHKH